MRHIFLRSIFLMCILALMHITSLAQGFGVYINPLPPNGDLLFGGQLNKSGVGVFPPTAGPTAFWHLYATGDRGQNPCILRLQTGNAAPTDAYQFSESAIQFHRGEIGSAGEWRMASIKPIPLNQNMCLFEGSLSFTTNLKNTRGMPDQAHIDYCVSGEEVEMVRMTGSGTGILQSQPREALHIWKRLTFHVGSEADYIGYNVTTPGIVSPTGEQIISRFSEPEPNRPNTPAMNIEFGRDGTMRFGNFGQGTNTDEIRKYEDGGDFKGLVIGNSSGWGVGQGVGQSELNGQDKTTVAVGMYWADPSSRLSIRGIGNTASTNALQILNSNTWGASPILTLNDNGNLGLKNVSPKAHFSIGSQFTFSDFTQSSILAHNAYYFYNDQNNQGWKRIQASNTQVKNRPARIEMVDGNINLEVGGHGVPESLISTFNYGSNGLFIYQGDNSTTANVGVGERTPNSRLSVRGTSNSAASSSLSINSLDNSSLLFVRDDGKVGIGTTTFSNQSTSSTIYGAENLRLKVAGDVQIGNQYNSKVLPSSYNSRLSVDGVIFAREVRVNSSDWADFVFKKEYTLPTLEYVENHIQEYGTLPDMPDEKEVKQNGFSLNEMQVKLLQKVEELTLYVIQLEKANKLMQNKVQKLENKGRK